MKIENNKPGLQWNGFKELCNIQFGLPMRMNHLGKLAELKQTETVEAYRSKFVQLAAQEPSFSSEQKVKLFLSGLNENISLDVGIQKPKDLTKAVNYARFLRDETRRCMRKLELLRRRLVSS